MSVRAALIGDSLAIAAATAEQPLLVRYGVTQAGLERSLTGAIERGEGVLVEEEGGAIRGFAWYEPRGTFALGGYLRLIALAPGVESRGLGKALLDEVERKVAEASRHMFLLVSDFNTSAQRFYERAGYARSGELPGLVLPDVTEFVYWKRLRA